VLVGAMVARSVEWAVRRPMGRVERDRLAVAVDDERGMQEAVFEAAPDRYRFVLGDEIAVLALTPGFDERTAAGVLEDELVAEARPPGP
jgi:hypothetical protein